MIVSPLQLASRSVLSADGETHGRIELVCGPMFSGKTTELLRRVVRHEFAQRKCCIMKYLHDKRFSDEMVSTHDKRMLPAIPCSELMSRLEDASKFEVIGVDEGQFFPDLVQFCEKLAARGRVVIVAALDGTFQRQPFGPISRLVPKCERMVKLSAVCKGCGRDAAFSHRISAEKQVELIGGSDMYIPLCRQCFQTSTSDELIIRKPAHTNPDTVETSNGQVVPSPSSSTVLTPSHRRPRSASRPRLAVSGQIQLVCGPMFSGKTSELIRRVRRLEHAGLRCLVIKYKNDTRYHEDNVSTHDRHMLPAVACTTLSEAEEQLAGCDVVGVDEGQFFPDLVAFTERAANAGKVVIVAALDGTYQRQPFGAVCDLMARCEHVVKLTAVCTTCGLDAGFTCRESAEVEVEVIGGSDKYEPLCRACFTAATAQPADEPITVSGLPSKALQAGSGSVCASPCASVDSSPRLQGAPAGSSKGGSSSDDSDDEPPADVAISPALKRLVVHC